MAESENKASSQAEPESSVAPFRSAEDRYRKIVETANEGIWTIDHLGRTTYVNRRMAEMLGYTTDEMYLRVHTDFMAVEDQPKGDVDMELRRQGTTEQWDQRYIRKDGLELWTLASCCPLYGEDGKFAGALGMFTDITARKRMELELRHNEEQLKTALKSRDAFLAMLSHELRAPLNPILLLASERASGLDDSDPHQEVFATITDNATHQARLIDDLLDLTKIGQGKLSLHKEPIDIQDIIRESVASSEPTANAKQVSLMTNLVDRRLLVFGDPARLQQVVANVINNAIKFTPPHGRIQVQAEDSGSGVLKITCIDTGIGMTAAELSRVFEPFTQGDHASRSGAQSFGGLGLGLSLSRMILELHGGRISAGSDGPGRGATLTIELPLMTAEATPRAVASMGPTGRARALLLSKVRVLVVDDHLDTRGAISHLLKRRGCEVRMVGSCAEAIQAARSTVFDVVLCDLGLPDGDGCELMRQLATEHGLKGIALTGFGSPSDIERSSAAGFASHLIKPIDSGKLEAALVALFPATGATRSDLAFESR